MEDEEIEKALFAYLKKKGFWQTERSLQVEQSRLSSAPHSETTLSRSERGPTLYHDGYSKLRSWAYCSLDLYKHELLRVLYPVFIHCFMDLIEDGHTQEARAFFQTFREDHDLMHLRDLQKLEGILSPSHLEEMELARSLRHSKVNIKLCEYSYNLLLQYLQKSQSFTMLEVINEHINFEVSSGQPVSISDDSDVVALVGNSQDLAKQVNQKEVRWGLLEDTIEERLEKTLSDSEKVEGENKDMDVDENKVAKLSIQWGIPSEYTIMIFRIEGVEQDKKHDGRRHNRAKDEAVRVVDHVTLGFGNQIATIENLPLGCEDTNESSTLTVLEKTVSCCNGFCDCFCCACCIKTCSKMSDQCMITLAQLCTALSCFACSECCAEVCCDSG